MRVALSEAIDRRLEHLIVARARRRNPVLRLMPAAWIRLVARPAAARLRRTAVRHALTVVAAPGIVLVLLTMH